MLDDNPPYRVTAPTSELSAQRRRYHHDNKKTLKSSGSAIPRCSRIALRYDTYDFTSVRFFRFLAPEFVSY